MTTTFAPADLDATGSSGESTPISIHTAAASSSGASYPREFSPYIDMAMPADADLSAIAAASGIHNFTLAFVLSSGSGIGWQGVVTTRSPMARPSCRRCRRCRRRART